MTESSVGFCIFYDWLEVFELLDKEDVADLVFAIGRYYTEGADIVEAVSDGIKPVALMISRQLERAKKRNDKKAPVSVNKSLDKKILTETKTEKETETKTDTNTETETEKNKETKQNPRTQVREDTAFEKEVAGGDSKEDFSFSSSEEHLPLPTLDEVERYAHEVGLSFVNTRQFFDYNERRGWEIDGKPVRDWHSLISIWNAKDMPIREESGNGEKRYGDFDINDAFERALKRSYGNSC